MRSNRKNLIRLMRALNKIDDQYCRVQRSLDVKDSLFVLLYACMDGEPLSQKDICEEWFIPRSTLNTTVKEQVEAGNIELIPCGNKQKLVSLTKNGRAFAERMLGPLLDAEERIARQHVSDELAEQLEEFGAHLESAFDPLAGSGQKGTLTWMQL